MFREIGSEFAAEIADGMLGSGLPIQEDSKLVFSGRTAIETVLRNEPQIKNALLPSYCCDSMIVPFRKAGISVSFYDVNYANGLQIGLADGAEGDCILWCNYFGFSTPMPDLTHFRSNGGIVIEDITHSFYSRTQSHEQSDYLVASLRKWEAVVSGGYCASAKGRFKRAPLQEPNQCFVNSKKDAMLKKQQYLSGSGEVDKAVFLQEFAAANEWLAENYSGKTIDPDSLQYLRTVDFQKHREQRIQNARVLYEGLRDNPDISFLFPIEKMDCPLFAPIIIEKGMRDSVRKKLINESIYCPVHWPHPASDCKSNLYELELSLICDHRYDEEDMKRIVQVLNNKK